MKWLRREWAALKRLVGPLFEPPPFVDLATMLPIYFENQKEISMSDKISHPAHYTQGIECWDYITSHKMGYLEGNIIKYVTRYKYKDGLDDLFKAKAYLQRLIEAQFGPPIVEPCSHTGDSPTCPCCDHPERGVCSGESTERPITATEILRLNGAIPLGPVNVDEAWLPASCAIPFGIADVDGSNIIPPLLDGRNCPADCGCPGHLEDMDAHERHVRDIADFLSNCDAHLEPIRSGSREDNTLGDYRRGGSATSGWMKKPSLYDPRD